MRDLLDAVEIAPSAPPAGSRYRAGRRRRGPTASRAPTGAVL